VENGLVSFTSTTAAAYSIVVAWTKRDHKLHLHVKPRNFRLISEWLKKSGKKYFPLQVKSDMYYI